MKRTLLTLSCFAAFGAALAQPATTWSLSQNAGWTQTLSASTGVRFMDAVNSNVMWLVGYDGFAPNRNYAWYSRTIDGGNTFTSGVIFTGTNVGIGDTSTYVIANMEGVDANTAWVSSYLKGPQAQGAIFRTTNGGANWFNMTAPGMYTNAASFCNIISMLTPSVGITMGDPVGGSFEIWRTTNGGNSWSQIPGGSIPAPGAGEYGLVDVYCKQGNSNIWFGTNKARVYRSTNGGLTWSVSTLPGVNTNTTSVSDMAFTDPNNGFVLAFDSSIPGYVTFRTTDGGATWINNANPTNLGKNDINAIPGSNYLISAGASTANTNNLDLSYSTNNGQTWTNWGNIGIQYLTIDFANTTTGWAGAFSQSVAPQGGVWKYTGPALNSTLAPTSAFQLPSYICFTAPSVTASPVNTSTGNPAPTYSWTGSAGVAFSSATASVPVITFSAAGVYTITLAATNSITSNSSSQVVTVQACATPTADFTFTTNVCNKVSFTVTNASSGTPTPTYNWTVAPSGTINPNPNATNPVITFSAPGVYSITLLATNQNGTASVTKTVNVNNCAPVPSFSLPASICASVAFNPTNTTTGNAPISYTWNVNPAAGSIAPNAVNPNPTITINNVNTYTITLIASNVSGSASVSQTVSVTSCNGIEENSVLANNLVVYPNPASDKITLQVINGVADHFAYTMTDIIGREVAKGSIRQDKVVINTGNMPKGVYFMTVESNGNKATKKIIIE